MHAATVRPAMADLWLALAMVTLAMAALSDWHHRRIADRGPLIVAILAVLHGLTIGRHPPLDMAIHLAVTLSLGSIALGAFFLGMMGGGDVKLMAALGLWLSPRAALDLVLVVALAGGLMGMGMVRRYRHRLSAPRVPYGLAIATMGIFHLSAQLT
jgi:prepilin peptidase CpaA